MKVKELKNQTGVKLKNGVLIVEPQPMLHCVECGAEYSANKGDYFAMDEEETLMCCGEELQLVKKVTKYERVG